MTAPQDIAAVDDWVSAHAILWPSFAFGWNADSCTLVETGVRDGVHTVEYECRPDVDFPWAAALTTTVGART